MNIHALAQALIDANNRAALCRDIGDYYGAVHWEKRFEELNDAMLRADTHHPERAIVTERGVA